MRCSCTKLTDLLVSKKKMAKATRIEDESENGDLPFDAALVQHNYSPKLVVTAKSVPVTFLWFTSDDDGPAHVNTKVFGPI